jgi:hypothetical protein
MNRSSVVTDGNPVYPQFRRDVHVSDRPLEVIPGRAGVVGLDFGRQPAALIGQCLRGDWFIQREFIGRDVSAVEFAPALKAYLAQHYPGFEFNFWGDPAGAHRGQATDKTPFMVFAEHGMRVLPAPNPQNQHSVRWEAVNGILMRRSSDGSRPSALLVDGANARRSSPACPAATSCAASAFRASATPTSRRKTSTATFAKPARTLPRRRRGQGGDDGLGAAQADPGSRHGTGTSRCGGCLMPWSGKSRMGSKRGAGPWFSTARRALVFPR